MLFYSSNNNHTTLSNTVQYEQRVVRTTTIQEYAAAHTARKSSRARDSLITTRSTGPESTQRNPDEYVDPDSTLETHLARDTIRTFFIAAVSGHFHRAARKKRNETCTRAKPLDRPPRPREAMSAAPAPG